MITITIKIEEIKESIIEIGYEGAASEETDGEVFYGKNILDAVEGMCSLIAEAMAKEGKAIHMCGPAATMGPALDKIREDIISGKLDMDKTEGKPEETGRSFERN